MCPTPSMAQNVLNYMWGILDPSGHENKACFIVALITYQLSRTAQREVETVSR